MSLDDFASALRDDVPRLRPARREAIRRRVLAPRSRKMRLVRWGLPIAAVLGAAAASAAIHDRPQEARQPVPAAPIATVVDTSAQPVVAPVFVVPLASANVEPAASHHVRRETPPHPRDDSQRVALDAYRAAERLQFTAKDYAHALVAWDRYLTLAVAGSPLTFDARYDRALCLMHLGQTDEARAALAPFAEAAPGSYRQREAKTLLDGLR